MGTLEPFPALAQQAPPASAPNASPVGVDGRPRRRLSPPVTPLAVRLRHVTADSQLGQRHQGLVAVISLYLPNDFTRVIAWSRAGRREHQ